MERKIIRRESDLTYHAIPASALRGRGPLALTRGIMVMLAGVGAAYQLLRTLQPGAILGTGGYVCVPLFLAARLARVPTMIYLPDVVPGMAVGFLARLATLVACNVADSRPYLKRSDAALRVTGYPVRAELFKQDQADCRVAFGLQADLPVLFVYGGSLGARSINRAVEALLPDLLKVTQIIHVCGREGDESRLRAAADRLEAPLQARYRLYPYLESRQAVQGEQGSTPAPTMVQAFGAADLALCRSGASTMAELPAAGLPAVLVPYPYVHQDENADYLVRHGAAVKIADAAMLGAGEPQEGPLFQHLARLLKNEDIPERRRMAECSRALARPDAARQLAALLIELAARRRSA